MLHEDRLRRLKSLRDSLASHDELLREASGGDAREVPLTHVRTIKGTIESVRAERPHSIPVFDSHRAATVQRSQIFTARSVVQDMIDAEEKRYELRLSVDNARALLKERIEGGETLANNPEHSEQYQINVESWAKQTVGELDRVFSSQLNAQDFEKLMQPENAPTFSDAATSGVEFLRSIDEQLYILQHASAGT